ncbi:MAG: FCD domain-containing protein, partial [Clostridia bacterium]|nr:FCD domain-containing protein [Clostridia bacterium]
FHSKIECLTDKKRILRVIESQQEYIVRFSAMTIASIERRGDAHVEHHQIVDALEARDLEKLKELMQHHLEESKETCLETVRARK